MATQIVSSTPPTDRSPESRTLHFPKTKHTLWNKTATGQPNFLHLGYCRKPRVCIPEKILRLIQHQSENYGQVNHLLIGSVAVEEDGEGVQFLVDRLNTKPKTQSGGPDLLSGDVPIPFKVASSDHERSGSTEDYMSAFKQLKDQCCSKDSIDLHSFIKLLGWGTFYSSSHSSVVHLDFEMITMATVFRATPITPVPIAMTALSKNLAGPMSLCRLQGVPKTGYLTMDNTRKVLLVLESDPKAATLPIVGIWISGVDSVQHPFVWAACLRYIYNTHLQERVCKPPEEFLLMLYTRLHSRPEFYQCDIYSGSTDMHFDLSTGNEVVQMTKALSAQDPDNFIEVEVEQVPLNAEKGRFDIAQEEYGSSTDKEKEKGWIVNKEDIEPRSAPVPHTEKIPKFQPVVPDVSILWTDTSQNDNDHYTKLPSHPPHMYRMKQQHPLQQFPVSSVPEPMQGASGNVNATYFPRRPAVPQEYKGHDQMFNHQGHYSTISPTVPSYSPAYATHNQECLQPALSNGSLQHHAQYYSPHPQVRVSPQTMTNTNGTQIKPILSSKQNTIDPQRNAAPSASHHANYPFDPREIARFPGPGLLNANQNMYMQPMCSHQPPNPHIRPVSERSAGLDQRQPVWTANQARGPIAMSTSAISHSTSTSANGQDCVRETVASDDRTHLSHSNRTARSHMPASSLENASPATAGVTHSMPVVRDIHSMAFLKTVMEESSSSSSSGSSSSKSFNQSLERNSQSCLNSEEVCGTHSTSAMCNPSSQDRAFPSSTLTNAQSVSAGPSQESSLPASLPSNINRDQMPSELQDLLIRQDKELKQLQEQIKLLLQNQVQLLAQGSQAIAPVVGGQLVTPRNPSPEAAHISNMNETRQEHSPDKKSVAALTSQESQPVVKQPGSSGAEIFPASQSNTVDSVRTSDYVMDTRISTDAHDSSAPCTSTLSEEGLQTTTEESLKQGVAEDASTSLPDCTQTVNTPMSQMLTDMSDYISSLNNKSEFSNNASDVNDSCNNSMDNSYSTVAEDASDPRQYYSQLMHNIQKFLTNSNLQETEPPSSDSAQSQMVEQQFSPTKIREGANASFLPAVNYVSMLLGYGSEAGQSMEINAMAMKYLSDEQLSHLANHRHFGLNGFEHQDTSGPLFQQFMRGHKSVTSTPSTPDISHFGISPTDLTLGTRDYLKKYGLLGNSSSEAGYDNEESLLMGHSLKLRTDFSIASPMKSQQKWYNSDEELSYSTSDEAHTRNTGNFASSGNSARTNADTQESNGQATEYYIDHDTDCSPHRFTKSTNVGASPVFPLPKQLHYQGRRNERSEDVPQNPKQKARVYDGHRKQNMSYSSGTSSDRGTPAMKDHEEREEEEEENILDIEKLKLMPKLL